MRSHSIAAEDGGSPGVAQTGNADATSGCLRSLNLGGITINSNLSVCRLTLELLKYYTALLSTKVVSAEYEMR